MDNTLIDLLLFSTILLLALSWVYSAFDLKKGIYLACLSIMGMLVAVFVLLCDILTLFG